MTQERVVRHKSIYVADMDIWDSAEKAAEARGISLSEYVNEALNAYNATHGDLEGEDPLLVARRLTRRTLGLLDKVVSG